MSATGRQGTDVLEEVDSGSPQAQQSREPEHLLLMVNGLFGSAENWAVTKRNLERLGQAEKMLMLASNTNLKLQTFDGIDQCGQRLAEEVRDCVETNPSLRRISVMGHSMGGLIARYAIGVLYDPAAKKVAKLEPRHFITLATPHLGCGGEGPAQVPFIGWAAEVPLVGSYGAQLLQMASNSFASTLLRRTGEQFFLLDKTAGLPPLLVRMVEDRDGEHFYSALSAFQSRTCVANSSGDHLVGWANSSLRHPKDLPNLGELKEAKGIVREDPCSFAFSLSQQRDEPSSSASQGASRSSEGEQEAERTLRGSEEALGMLAKLQQLPWCRMDCSFQGTTFPYFAHNLVQVTREWINWEGENVVQRLAQHFSDLEAIAESGSVSRM